MSFFGEIFDNVFRNWLKYVVTSVFRNWLMHVVTSVGQMSHSEVCILDVFYWSLHIKYQRYLMIGIYIRLIVLLNEKIISVWNIKEEEAFNSWKICKQRRRGQFSMHHINISIDDNEGIIHQPFRSINQQTEKQHGCINHTKVRYVAG